MTLDQEIHEYLNALSPEQLTQFVKASEECLPLATLPRDWKPRPYQQRVWNYLKHGGRHAILIWHRRSGKDDVALHWAAYASQLRPCEIWHMLPEASQARKAIWDSVDANTGRRRIYQAFPSDIVDSINESEMKIRFKNGSLWRVVGSDNYDSLVGSSPVGIIYSEWALANPASRAFFRPIILQNKGWELFITTPRGANHAFKTYEGFRDDPDGFAEILTANDTQVFTSDELLKELKDYQRDYGEEEGAALFEQEYNCSFAAALIGSYYGAYLTKMRREGRICSVPVDRAALVHTAWDLGVGDSTAIWFIQVVGREKHLVDYHEGSGVGFDTYARILAEKQRLHNWIYGFHYFPHDVAVHELGHGLSRIDTLRGLGIKATVVPVHHPEDGINAVRRMLDSTWIDEKRCERGLNSLLNYRREWDERLKIFRDNPVHDWASHGADALRTFAAGYKEPKERMGTTISPPKPWGGVPEQGTGWMGQ